MILYLFIFLILCNIIFIIYYTTTSSNIIEYSSHYTLPNNLINFTQFDEMYNTHSLYKHKSKRIPKFIFRSSHFLLTKIPIVIYDHLYTLCMTNPDYLVIYFDDTDCYNFIQKYFPEYIIYYNSLKPTAFKSDLWRLLLLYKYGGIYSDIGHVYLTPITHIIQPNDELVVIFDNGILSDTTKFAIHNAFMAAFPKHPIILYIIKYIVNNIKNQSYGENYLDITGPMAVGRALNLFMKRKHTSPLLPQIINYKHYHIKILPFEIDNSFSLGHEKQHHILNHLNQRCILTKFPRYYYIMYDNRKIPHYSTLWEKKEVFIPSIDMN